MTTENQNGRFALAFDIVLRFLQDSASHMTLEAVRVLIFLHRHPSSSLDHSQQDEPLASISDLAEWVGVKQPTMTRIVRMLGEGDTRLGDHKPLDLVSSHRDPAEHRRKIVSLTPRGVQVMNDAFSLADGAMRGSANIQDDLVSFIIKNRRNTN
jgi:DNA-binding MarR family transcriptional regulator